MPMHGARVLCTMSWGEPRSIVMKPVLVLLTAALLAWSAGSSWGVSFEPKEFNQLVAEAEQIFVGTVTAAASRITTSGAGTGSKRRYAKPSGSRGSA